MEISQDIVDFFKKNSVMVIATFGPDGAIHCAIKEIVDIKQEGKVFVVDLFRHRTLHNIKNNPLVSVTAFDEHAFTGYTLQGKASIVEQQAVGGDLIKKWEKQMIKRISNRVISGVRRDVKSRVHHEDHMPQFPRHLIEVDVDKVIDLSPPHFKGAGE
jgi:general stress protein 26